MFVQRTSRENDIWLGKAVSAEGLFWEKPTVLKGIGLFTFSARKKLLLQHFMYNFYVPM
jgi:hypothetical protein